MDDDRRLARISEIEVLIALQTKAVAEILDLDLELPGQSSRILSSKHRDTISAYLVLIGHHRGKLGASA